MTSQLPELPETCLWPVDPACKTNEWESIPESLRLRGLAMASLTLERLSGYRVTNCPVTVRPILETGHDCLPPSGGFGMPLLGVLRLPRPHPNEIRLEGPVGRVDEIKIDGVAQDLDDFGLIDGHTLVWMGDGPSPIPTTQDIHLPDTEVGTFSVTYLRGHRVDQLGAYAVGVLALEYAKACQGNRCRLPSGVTSIVRQGVSMEVMSGAFPGGLTGIREVDSWIALWNPNALQQGASVLVPGEARPRTVTRLS